MKELRAATQATRFALARHLAKLKVRGFIGWSKAGWSLVPQQEPLARALARMALD